MQPDDVSVRIEGARALARSGRRADAERLLREIRMQYPAHAGAAFTLATLLLARGEYREGFRLYEARFDAVSPRAKPYPWPLWGGEPLSGRSIAVRCEQGFGDIIQYSRYLPLLKRERGAAHVTAVVPPPLRSLLQGMPDVDLVLSEGDQLRRPDCWAWIGSLPHRFGTTVDTVPNGSGYIRADPHLCEKWKPELPGRRPRIGLAWAGAGYTPSDKHRSLGSIHDLAPLFALTEAAFVAFQRDRDEEIAASGLPLLPLGNRFGDFADVAGAMDQLDMFISVDTAYAHLAGAMGKPTCLLVGAAHDWRWMAEGPDSPWYSTMTIHRQQRGQPWEEVARAVAAFVARWIADASRTQ